MLSIIIVNYRVNELLKACLNSLSENPPQSAFEIIVVENSEKEWADKTIKGQFPQIKMIINGLNRGFAAACNQGIKESKGDLILLLNPDTIVLKGSIEAMLDFMELNPQAGIIGGKLLGKDKQLHEQISCTGLFSSPLQSLFEYTLLAKLFPQHRLISQYNLTSWDRNTVKEVAMAQGACLMLRRKVIETIGLFDERFFLYFEEADLCLRAINNGFKVYYLPAAEFIHYGGKSFSKKSEDKIRAQALERKTFFKSFYQFQKKHYGNSKACLLRAAILIGSLLELGLLSLALLLKFKERKQRKYGIIRIINQIQAQF